MNQSDTPILFSNSFPFSLIRRAAIIEPHEIKELRNVLATRPFVSFWGHKNTQKWASRILGKNIQPLHADRPAIHLGEDDLPMAGDKSCRECWLLSPQYVDGFRPQEGEEINEEKISGWQVLAIKWT